MSVSNEFIWRRFHSLMGFWIVLYLILHLIVNSQAALWLGNDGSAFIRMVNSLESLPYLHVVESVLIGIPLLVHGVWGIKRSLEARTNAWPNQGNSPALGKYGRNQAFTWQRITAWILLFGIAGHVIQMRFVYQPKMNEQHQYWVRVTPDPGLYCLADRLGATVSTTEDQKVIVTAPTPGSAMLFMVRNSFKSPLMAVLYTVFVLSAAFHAFNGFWTFLITWGLILSYRSQKAMIPVGWVGAIALSFLGLAAIWGSYLG